MRKQILHTFGIFIFLSMIFCIVVLRYSQKEVQLCPPLPHRRSLLLSDGRRTYELNMNQFEEEFPALQSYNCTLLINKEGFCHSTSGRLLIILAIKSHPSSSYRRAALRETWAKEQVISGYVVKPLFLMAISPKQGHMNLVAEENRAYNDILLWDFTESHHNLSLKERCFIEWLYYSCQEVEFIFKGDDDEFVNPEEVVRYVMKTTNASNIVHGFIQSESVTVRQGKYKISESLYPFTKYPSFPSGGGFIFPGASVPALYNASTWIPVFPLDDVYFGFLGLVCNLSYHHDNRFYVSGLRNDICLYKKALVVHGLQSEMLLTIWHDLQKDKKCSSTK
ncbi:beta-1,3-galactosyltransferase 5-like [Rhinatrema bivittatum]|uniref:beta-1,3-galactosyltransferase 5-like n=1 Tax=Rhinatrema bivittatum TaxID=194408 RepID=UPI00112A8413|nr:beta-1,3-galactosyltransferase 5-like [Rhinatrema bivittatum]